MRAPRNPLPTRPTNPRSRLSPALILALLALPQPGRAATSVPDRPCDGNSTLDIVDCLVTKATAWKPKLNRAYQALSKQIPAQQRQPLADAQAQWVKFRDANCRFYGAGEGTISQIAAAECIRAALENRTLELERAAMP